MMSREPTAPETPPVDSSRASSPLPSRASTPPPSLPAPSLIDLGLSLSCITSHLSPSHFSSPPWSGAFLQPHYLLLCHAQGLDVVPLVSPPAPQPYSLIRRVPFKSVVVMEHRGVLVAIAGRRDGVRVYALEEVKRAVEWRVELEVKREREKARREEMKRGMVASHEAREKKSTSEKETKGRKMPPFPSNVKAKPDRRATVSIGSPSTPTPRVSAAGRPQTPPPMPAGPPPAYSASTTARTNSAAPVDTAITVTRPRTTSVNDVLAGTFSRHPQFEDHALGRNDTKCDWASSDDEAIDPVAAPSGSEALDERTSSLAPNPGPGSTSAALLEVPRSQSTQSVQARRNRPSNLDLSLTRANPPTNAVPTNPPPSPAPTLLTLRQALMASPGSVNVAPAIDADENDAQNGTEEQDGDGDEEDDPAPSSPTTPTRERISLAEALMESRLPELPPIGTQQPQEAVLLSSVGSGDEELPGTPRSSESFSTRTRQSVGDRSFRRRRRWSVLDGIFPPGAAQPSIEAVSESGPNPDSTVRTPVPSTREMRERQPSLLTRSQSSRALPALPSSIGQSDSSSTRPSTAPSIDTALSSVVQRAGSTRSQPHSNSGPRFLPRIITNVFGRRSEDQPSSPRFAEQDGRRSFATPVATQAPAPKLEYVKLPGTKGSIMVKAVETAKKR